MLDNTDKLPGGTHLEERVIQALASDHLYAAQMMEVMKAEHFHQQHLSELFSVIQDHYSQYKMFPTLDGLESKTLGNKRYNDSLREQMSRFFNKVRANPCDSDMPAVKDESLNFCRKSTLLLAIQDCLDMAERNDYCSIVKSIQEAVSRGAERNMGHIYKEEDALVERMSDAREKPVATPWKAINAITQGGISAGELAVILALTGVGKSHALIDIGAAAAEAGLNVVHFTFELSEVKLGKRYDARFSGVPFNNLMFKQEKVQQAIAKLAGSVRIKKYPNRQATVLTIHNYVTKLRAQGIHADLLVVDYADIMQSSKRYENKRFEEEAVYEELRSLADELHIPIWTASQTNRTGMDVDVLTLKHIAECFAKANISDLFLTMNRKKTGEDETLGNIFVAKNRMGADGIKFHALINTALSRVSVLEKGSDAEREALAQHDMKLESDTDKLRKYVEVKLERGYDPANGAHLQLVKNKEINTHGY